MPRYIAISQQSVQRFSTRCRERQGLLTARYVVVETLSLHQEVQITAVKVSLFVAPARRCNAYGGFGCLRSRSQHRPLTLFKCGHHRCGASRL